MKKQVKKTKTAAPYTIQHAHVTAFLKNNKGVDLRSFDFHDMEAQGKLKLSGKSNEQKAQLHTLLAFQRLLRLHPSEEVAEQLYNAGLHSAHAIASYTEDAFVAKYAKAFGKNKTAASEVYTSAVGVKALSKQTFATVHSLIGSPHYRNVRGFQADAGLVAYVETMPGYDQLFGGQNYCGCEHCNSIFGPAAYFLDIMRVTDEYITQPNLTKSVDNIPAGFTLQGRRPDLFEMKLDCANTNDPIPFLTIVNKILQRIVEGAAVVNTSKVVAAGANTLTLASSASSTDGAYIGMDILIGTGTGAGQIRQIIAYTGSTRLATVSENWDTLPETSSTYVVVKNAFQELAVAKYPFNLPYNLPLNQIRQNLQQLNTSLFEIYEDFQTIDTGGAAAGGTATTIVFDSSASAVDDYYKNMFVWIVGGKGYGQIREVASYAGSTKTATLTEAWTTIPDTTSQYQVVNYEGTAREFIGLTMEDSKYLSTPRLTNAELAPFYGDTQIDLATICVVTVFMHKTGLSRAELDELLIQGLSGQELANNVADTFYINATGESLPYMKIVVDSTIPDDPFFKIENISILRLDRMNRFIRLAKKLGWSFAALNWAMRSLGKTDIDANLLQDVSLIQQLKTFSGLDVDVICSFWYTIKTMGKGNGRWPDDLFDRIYNNPALLDGQDPYNCNPPIPFDPAQPMRWLIADRSGTNAVIRSRLTAALMITDNELTELGIYVAALFGITDGTLLLDLDKLSWLYRITKAASIFSMTINEYLVMLGLQNYPDHFYLTPPVNSITLSLDTIFEQKSIRDWMAPLPFTVYELLFIIRGQESIYYQPGLTESRIVTLVKELAVASETARLNAASFKVGSNDAEESAVIFAKLVENHFLTPLGILLNSPLNYASLSFLMPLNEKSFTSGLIDETASQEVYTELQAKNILLPIAGGATSSVSESYSDRTSLNFLFDTPNQDKTITSYNGTTKAVIVGSSWTTVPVEGDTYNVISAVQGGNVRQLLITLPADASATENAYDGMRIEILSGPGAGQANTITVYNPVSKVAAVAQAWTTVPASGSVFAIRNLENSGTAMGGGVSNIILATSASAQSEYYSGMKIAITGGTGSGQVNTILTYNSNTRNTVVETPWTQIPDATSVYEITSLALSGMARNSVSSVCLSSAASAADNAYKGMTLRIASGTGAGQWQPVIAYNGTTKVALLQYDFDTVPDATSVYSVDSVVDSGTVRSVTITLAADASATSGAYNGMQVLITAGTAAGELRTILAYDGTTQAATVDTNWGTAPDTTSVYEILSLQNSGYAATATTSTIRLAADASTVNDAYKDAVIAIITGEGANQVRTITAYDGATKTATVNTGWDVLPDYTSLYTVTKTETSGTARANNPLLVSLSASASGVDDAYKNMTLSVLSDADAVVKREQVADVLLDTQKQTYSIESILKGAYELQRSYVVGGIADFLGAPTGMVSVYLDYSVLRVGLLNYLREMLTPPVQDEVNPLVYDLVKLEAQGLLLAEKLLLTETEVSAVLNSPREFNIEDPEQLTLANIHTLAIFKYLTVRYNDTNNALLTYLTMPSGESCPNRKTIQLSKVTGWNTEQICSLIQWFWPAGKGHSMYDDDTVEGIERMSKCFTLSSKTGMDLYTLYNLYSLNYTPLTDASNTIIQANWSNSTKLSSSTLDAVNSKFEDVEFTEIYRQIVAALDMQKRDALVGYTIWILNTVNKYEFITDSASLYQWLLIDVEMSGCDSVSLIAQGISSVQLYMQRCHLNLEPYVTIIKIKDVWWEWLSGYRLWEVNRKIYLYPENYLDPSLRKGATDIFNALKDELLQNNITSATVDAAYKNYFDGFSVLANLKYVDSYHAEIEDPTTKEITKKVFVFGQTNTDPYEYYYRTYELALNLWSPWIKMELTISSPYISPVFAHGKLFIFWVEMEETPYQEVVGGTSTNKAKAWTAKVKYSFYNQAGEWTQPQENTSTIVADFVPDSYGNPLFIDPSLINPYDLYWRKVYALRVPPKTIPGPPVVEYPERILVILGAIYNLSAFPITVPSPPDPLQYAYIEKFVFDSAIYETTYRANQAVVNKNSRAGMIFLNTASLIGPTLEDQQFHFVALNYNSDNLDPQPYRPVISTADAQLKVNLSTNVIYDNYFSDYTYRPSAFSAYVYAAKGQTVANVQKEIAKGLKNMGVLWPDKVKKKSKITAAATVNSLDLLYNISKNKSQIITVKNQPGWFVFNNGDEEFLLTAADPDLHTITGTLVERNLPVTGMPDEIDLWNTAYTSSTIDFSDLKFNVTRLTTSTIQALNRKLFAGGIDMLITPESQETPEIPFSRFYNNGDPSSSLNVPDPAVIDKLDFNGAYGLYFQEIFFHSAFLIADTLNSNFDFEAAKSWYEYIYNPTQPLEAGVDPSKRYWRYIPFRSYTLESLTEILQNPFQIAVYNNDPFNPDAIAALRSSAYPKAIVMKYIKNLVDWGDQLFTMDTRESITQATNLYVMAADLLGRKPEMIGECTVPEPKSFNEIKQESAGVINSGAAQSATASTIQLAASASSENNAYQWKTITITSGTGAGQTRLIASYAGSTRTATVTPVWGTQPAAGSLYEVVSKGIPEFLISIENSSFVYNPAPSPIHYSDVPYNDINSYFCVPENQEFVAYWALIEDRLFKIRHCMNIDGVERSLALFAPPLDPRAVIRAVAAGGSASFAQAAAMQVPYFRFDTIITSAKSFTSVLSGLGGELLAALEKKDAEALSLLRNRQEKAILQLTTTIKQDQIEQAKESLQALQESQLSAKKREDYYKGLVKAGLSSGEVSNLQALEAALVFNILSSALQTASSIAYTIPNVGSPFAMTYGGIQIGSMLAGASAVFGIGAQVSQFVAERTLTMSQYQRRSQEWEFLGNQAELDYTQIGYQIEAAQTQVEIATQDLVVHEKNIEQNDEMEFFLKGKFTNEELYKWMSGQLSTVYFQTYSLAYELAASAQKAFQYEFDTNRTFLKYGYWDSLHKGLLAGETLMFGLSQMEKAAIDNGKRPLEITKNISLVQLNPKALLDLVNTGRCRFEFTEKLFDYDFPGHYARKIKSISISIPAVTGPYQSVKATLTQLSNQVVLKPDADAVNYLLGGNSRNVPSADVLRTNWWLNQQIAISKGVNDSGLFELNFNDPRYLPFEGTGAVSTWELSLPMATNRIDFNTISDVVVQLSYTAFEGGDAFRRSVTSLDALKPFYYAAYFSLVQQYAQQWFAFMNESAAGNQQTMTFLSPPLIPPHVTVPTAKMNGLYFLLKTSVPVSGGGSFMTLLLDDGKISIPVTLGADQSFTFYFATGQVPPPKLSAIQGKNVSVVFDLSKTPSTLKMGNGALNPEVLANIQLAFYNQGELKWS